MSGSPISSCWSKRSASSSTGRPGATKSTIIPQIYDHPRAPLVLNLQPEKNGKAKAYQVRKLLRDIDLHGLRLEDEE